MQSSTRYSSVRVGDIDRLERRDRAARRYRRYLIRLAIIASVIAVLIVAAVSIYNSSLFTVTKVSVKGVEHLTTQEMTDLAAVPAGTTLLRVDASGIKGRLLKDAWVKDATVHRVFPDTLELSITERTIAAVVSVPVDTAQTIEEWAIAAGGTWLMAIPPENSPKASSISPKIYEDAAEALHISAVPIGVKPVVGEVCSDQNIMNALTIVDGLTTELADQVASVKAYEQASTSLILDNGVEIAWGTAGTAEQIREKERVVLQLMAEHPDSISYINVRVVDRPTWRAL